MSETRGILGKISALRQRLESACDRAREAGETAKAQLVEPEPPGLARLWELERQAACGSDHHRQIDAAVKQTTEAATALPRQLTARARRALEKGREVLHALRDQNAEPLVHEPGGLLAALYRETTSLAEAALRQVMGLPDSPAEQLKACETIELLLDLASRNLGRLAPAIRRMRLEEQQVSAVAEFLDRLEAGRPVDLNGMAELAENLLDEASQCVPLRFVSPPAPMAERAWVARLVGGHCLSVARVIARLVRHDPDLRGRAVECVVAALLHDVGMLHVAPEITAHVGPLGDDEKRAIEGHCHTGAFLMARTFPGSAWLVEVADRHHERMDGTGYPDGLRGESLSPLVRLLAVCDSYAAECQARPQRPARGTRTALADTLLLAEKGLLDRHCAERLMQLSFYPAGSVVELADGAVAVVIAAQAGRHDLQAPARPVVALLTDSQGHFLPAPWYLDLSQGDGHSIVRALDGEERRRVLGTRYLEWAL